jgi:hypothetical protein
MYSSFSYICLITLSKVDGIALRRRCDQSCCLGTVSYACEKSTKATCNLGLFLGFSFFAACLRCLRINRGCRVLLPGKKPNALCVWNLTLFHTPISHQIFQHVGKNTIHHPTNRRKESLCTLVPRYKEQGLGRRTWLVKSKKATGRSSYTTARHSRKTQKH